MTPVCDFCRPGLGDHDRPFEFHRTDHVRLRFTVDEIRRLLLLRRQIRNAQAGRGEGPGSGDTGPDPRDHGAAA